MVGCNVRHTQGWNCEGEKRICRQLSLTEWRQNEGSRADLGKRLIKIQGGSVNGRTHLVKTKDIAKGGILQECTPRTRSWWEWKRSPSGTSEAGSFETGWHKGHHVIQKQPPYKLSPSSPKNTKAIHTPTNFSHIHPSPAYHLFKIIPTLPFHDESHPIAQ